ncbi:MotA/TolQ/ExbB proton channel family protein [Microbaculum marinum]|uniref:MotA/TolQ/ExbB proton channel family protein n=1 Tax=Microbaculum marinum TaxID=1764581 RepID=A0AAW9RT65_9HYPH
MEQQVAQAAAPSGPAAPDASAGSDAPVSGAPDPSVSDAAPPGPDATGVLPGSATAGDSSVPDAATAVPGMDATGDPTVGTQPATADDGGLLDAGVSGLDQLVDLGGPIVALLLVLSVVALTIALVKLWQFARFGVGRRRLEDAVRRWCSEPDAVSADRAANVPGPVAALVSRAMTRLVAGDSETYAREEIEQGAEETVASLRSYLRALEAIAQAAPLLGLLGTVLGMIDAFKVLEASGGDVDPAGLAGGIWVALMTTAVGLAVAIPTALALHWFDGRVEKERRRIERLATQVLTHPPHAGAGRVLPEPVSLRDFAGAAARSEPAHAH